SGCCFSVFVFFFQAEDGIRDLIVTGVQTCALPIFPMALDERSHRLFVGTRRPAMMLVLDTESGREVAAIPIGGDADDIFIDRERSEERRVGKECRSRRAREQ